MRGAGADSWDYTAPEWIVATQEENTLSVNAKDNTEASRVGRIEFIAGNAEQCRSQSKFQKFSTNKKFRRVSTGTFYIHSLYSYSRTVRTPLPSLMTLSDWDLVQ